MRIPVSPDKISRGVPDAIPGTTRKAKARTNIRKGTAIPIQGTAATTARHSSLIRPTAAAATMMGRWQYASATPNPTRPHFVMRYQPVERCASPAANARGSGLAANRTVGPVADTVKKALPLAVWCMSLFGPLLAHLDVVHFPIAGRVPERMGSRDASLAYTERWKRAVHIHELLDLSGHWIEC